MPEMDEVAAQIVVEDLNTGLRDSFESEVGPKIVDASRTNGESTAVEWEYECRHSGLFQGLNPTGKQFTITGVTLVSRHLTGEDEPLLSRFVDWAQVMNDLGMYASYRPTIESG
jgi:hypothetical protein